MREGAKSVCAREHPKDVDQLIEDWLANFGQAHGNFSEGKGFSVDISQARPYSWVNGACDMKFVGYIGA